MFISSIYMIVFGNLAKLGTDGIPRPLFYFGGTMLWTFFSESLLKISNVFITNKNIFGKIYFPRLTVPIADSIVLILKLSIQFLLFLVIYVLYVAKGIPIKVSYAVLLFPFLVVWVALLSAGLGLIISSITTKYRDLIMVLHFLISLAMYATPVVYPLSQIPGKMKIVFDFTQTLAKSLGHGASTLGRGASGPWNLCAETRSLRV